MASDVSCCYNWYTIHAAMAGESAYSIMLCCYNVTVLVFGFCSLHSLLC